MNLPGLSGRCWGAALLALAGCHNGGDTGRLSMAVADAPVDNATKVVVQFSGLQIKPTSGELKSFDFAAPRAIDLLALSGGLSAKLLDGVEVDDGRYKWLQLKIAAQEDGVLDSYIELKDGTRHELAVSGAGQATVKLDSVFTVAADGRNDFTIDFDLRKSVHQPAFGSAVYKLEPVLRLVDNAQAGAIAGTVDAGLITAGCTPAVYVFEGANRTPDDVDDIPPEPLTSATVALDAATGQYRYRAAFLAAGDYTVAFTCQAAADDPGSDDFGIEFIGTRNAAVAANRDTTVDFSATPGPPPGPPAM
ncbi:MAG: DUF4382 domain-containing protein [Gammaproteobacteria bacterium]|nr:DUF4382 domain-containing protein [Gammaproteobacteria bacterium]